MSMLKNSNMQIAKLMDMKEQQERAKEQRKAMQARMRPTQYGGSPMGMLLTAFSGASRAGIEGGRNIGRAVAGTEQAPVTTNQDIARIQAQEALQGRQSDVSNVASEVNRLVQSGDLTTEQGAQYIRDMSTGMTDTKGAITGARADAEANTQKRKRSAMAEKLRGRTPEELKVIHRGAIASGNMELADLAQSMRDTYDEEMSVVDKLKLAKELQISVADVDKAVMNGDYNKLDFSPKSTGDNKINIDHVRKLAEQYEVPFQVAFDASKSGDFSKVVKESPAFEENTLTLIGGYTGIPTEELTNVYDKDTLRLMTGTVMDAQLKGKSDLDTRREISLINTAIDYGVNGKVAKNGGAKASKSTVDKASNLLAIDANILQKFSEEAVSAATQHALMNQDKEGYNKGDSLSVLMNTQKTGRITPIHTTLGMTEDTWNEIPARIRIRANIMSGNPPAEGETEIMKNKRIKTFIAESLDDNAKLDAEVPTFNDVIGNRGDRFLENTYRNGSIDKALKAHGQGLLEGETPEQFKVRIQSMLVPKGNEAQEEYFNELRKTNQEWAVIGSKTVPSAYSKADLAFTDILPDFIVSLNKYLGMNEDSVIASEYIDRIMGDITLGKAQAMSGALSDNDIKFLKKISGGRDLNPESLKEALYELYLQRKKEVVMFKVMSKYASEGNTSKFNEFNPEVFLNTKSQGSGLTHNQLIEAMVRQELGLDDKNRITPTAELRGYR